MKPRFTYIDNIDKMKTKSKEVRKEQKSKMPTAGKAIKASTLKKVIKTKAIPLSILDGSVRDNKMLTKIGGKLDKAPKSGKVKIERKLEQFKNGTTVVKTRDSKKSLKNSLPIQVVQKIVKVPSNVSPTDVLLLAQKILEDGKMLNIGAYHCPESYYVNNVIIATGTSTRHIGGVLNKLRMEYKSKLKIIPLVDERVQDWIVVDAGSTVIHLMTGLKREHYNIETKMLEIEAKPV